MACPLLKSYSIFVMKQYTPLILLLLALLIALLTLFGDKSLTEIRALNHAIEFQADKNANLRATVQKLKQEVTGLRSDDRILEKAARNELGMTRPGEKIFIFKKEEEGLK